MTRDPAPDAHTPHGDQAPGAQPLTDILLTPPARASRPPTPPPVEAPPPVELTIDGATVTVPAGTTILGACRQQGIDTPTLCYAENLTPVNVCRVCVVEVTGSRVLVPACSRVAEPGMDVQTDSERVRTSRKVVLEFLGSSVDVSLAGPAVPDGSIHDYMTRYGADPARYGPPAEPAAAGERDAHDAGHHHAARRVTPQPPPSPSRPRSTTTSTCATTRSASSATSASRRAARTPRTRSRSRSRDAASMRASRPSRPCPLPESACVYCGNCIGVCPTGALMAKPEYDMRAAGHLGSRRSRPSPRRSARTAASAAWSSLHVQDDRILKVTSPLDSSVTEGHLCIKGRFGFEFVNERPKGPTARS